MHKIILVLGIAFIATGCYGSQMAQMDKRLAQTERENASLRRQNAQLRKQESGPQPLVSVPEPKSSMDVTEVGSTPRAGTTVTRAWVRRQHGAYLCFVNNDPHLSQGDRITFTNDIHDNYGMVTQTNTVRNKWVSIRLNNEPVMMLRASLGGYIVGYHLGPAEKCTAGLGGSTSVTVVSELYKNKGSSVYPQLLATGFIHRREFAINPMQDHYTVAHDRFTFR